MATTSAVPVSRRQSSFNDILRLDRKLYRAGRALYDRSRTFGS